MGLCLHCFFGILLPTLVPASGPAEPLLLEGGRLYLTKGGQVLYQRDVEVTLTKGENQCALGLVPVNVVLATLDLWATKENPQVTVLEISLKTETASDKIAEGFQELHARFAAKVEGKFGYRLAFPLIGFSWSVSNTCRLSEQDQGAISCSLHLTNHAGIGLSNVIVLVPELAAPEPIDHGERAHIVPFGAHLGILPESRTEPVLRPLNSMAIPSHASHVMASETEMFKLDRPVSIKPVEAKTFPVSHWPGLAADGGYLLETGFSGDRRNLPELVSAGHLWGQVKTTACHVMKVTPAADVDPATIRLFPGQVRLLGLFETSLTYTLAARWSRQDSTVSLYVPRSDIQCHRSQTKFDQVHKGHVCEEEIRVSLTNKSDRPAEVRLLEPLFRAENFTIVDTSIPYVVTDDARLEFSVKLDSKARKTIVYRVRYELD